MKSINFLLENLTKFHENFSYLDIKYEYRDFINTHIIEVRPVDSFINDKQYALAQIKLEDTFENLFPQEEILFITEGKLISVENPILELNLCIDSFGYVFSDDLSKVNLYTEISTLPTYKLNDIELTAFDIPSYTYPPPKKWYDKINLKNKKDFDENQSLFYLNLYYGRNKTSLF